MRKLRVFTVTVSAFLCGVWLLSAFGATRQTATYARRIRSEPSRIGQYQDKETNSSLGRETTGSPADIPARGWCIALKRVGQQFVDHRLMYEAASVIFFVLLAIFPAITAVVSLYGLFSDPRAVADHASMLSRLIPGGSMDILKNQLIRVAAEGRRPLSIGLVFGFVVSLWSSNRGMKALFYVLNVAYGEQENRGYIRLTLITLAFTVASLVFATAAMCALFALPSALQFFRLGDGAWLLVPLLRWPILLSIAVLFLSAIYRYGPSRAHERWRWVTWGGASAAIAWLLASFALSYYVDRFGTFDKTYGPLGAAIGFMTWVWISVMIVLLGAELNAELERQGALDSNGPR